MIQEKGTGARDNLLHEILDVFQQNPTHTFNYKQVAGQLRVDIRNKNIRKQIPEILNDLALQKKIVEEKSGKYKLKHTNRNVEGIMDFTAHGAAYLVTENEEKDIFIPPRYVHQALHGDKVKVQLLVQRKNKLWEGEVIKILERNKTEFIGIVEVYPRYAFLIPDNSKMFTDIFIPLENLHHAKHGQKAIAAIVNWEEENKNPTGKIISVLGMPGENEAEMHAILAEYGFPLSFPGKVEEEAANISLAVPKSELKIRKDFRKITTFTIDPEDAKDFDDALSFKKLPNGNTEVGVHIADVSYYVKPDTELNREAFQRATSVYLVDRVVPMLPEKLSNGVCSLRPDEDKLCFSAVFELDDDANVISQWFGKTVIHSQRRFTYDEVQKIIEAGKHNTEKENPKKESKKKIKKDFASEILLLDELAKKLRKQRFKNGSISFEKLEVKFHLDEKGNPTGVYFKENKDSNQLIEEFMLLANKKTAEFVAGKTKHKGSFVFRVHDAPIHDKLDTFARFAQKFGYNISTHSPKSIAQSLNKLLKTVAGKKEAGILEQLAMRTMAKAIYTTKNIGHYGLAFDHYTHFTSPIRRYPDILVHRLLEHELSKNKTPADKHLTDVHLLEKTCKHATDMEIRATDAERTSIKYKQVQFLEDKKGHVFEGVISGVTEWGIYVELTENKCEGLIHIRELDDDYYVFDENNYCLTGKRKKRKYRLGDTITVKIKNTNLLKKQIDMVPTKKF